MSKEMKFAIFTIEYYKIYRNLTGKEVYCLFKEYGVLDYIIEFYNVLHTTGVNYMNQDIDCFLEVREHTF